MVQLIVWYSGLGQGPPQAFRIDQPIIQPIVWYSGLGQGPPLAFRIRLYQPMIQPIVWYSRLGQGQGTSLPVEYGSISPLKDLKILCFLMGEIIVLFLSLL